MSRAIPAFDPKRRPMRDALARPRAAEPSHVAVDADRAHAQLAGYGDVGTSLPALASDLRWTHARTRVALSALRSAQRAECTGLAWRVTEAS